MRILLQVFVVSVAICTTNAIESLIVEKFVLDLYSGYVSYYVTFNLFTRNDPNNSVEVTIASAAAAPFNPNIPTEVIIHGYLQNDDQQWIIDMKRDYFQQGNYNVVTIDWSKYESINYFEAAKKTKAVGEYVGMILLAVEQAGLIKLNDIHLVGFSLGAHVAGFTGKYVKWQTGKLLGRITALDAAGPLFEIPWLVSENERLVKGDAAFVDAIHTSEGTYGFRESFADADFFPNGIDGKQPGCVIFGFINVFLCDHIRGYVYYSVSINYNKFEATSCSDYETFEQGKCASNAQVPMGFFTPTTTRGNFYLYTNEDWPYAQG